MRKLVKNNVVIIICFIVLISTLLTCCAIQETSKEVPETYEKIAYTSDRDGNDEVYIINIDSSEQINLIIQVIPSMNMVHHFHLCNNTEVNLILC